jgi:hypothetical protein
MLYNKRKGARSALCRHSRRRTIFCVFLTYPEQKVDKKFLV